MTLGASSNLVILLFGFLAMHVNRSLSALIGGDAAVDAGAGEARKLHAWGKQKDSFARALSSLGGGGARDGDAGDGRAARFCRSRKAADQEAAPAAAGGRVHPRADDDGA